MTNFAVWHYNRIIFAGFLFLIILCVPVFADFESPKKQLKHGIEPERIVCNHELTLVIRPNELPACVKPTTAEILEKYGWKIIIPKFEKAQNEIETVPASSGTNVNFYITDDDLNTSHSGVDIIDIEDLLEFSINGIVIEGPETMIETGPDTGKFFVKLELPSTVNGASLDQGDIIQVRYDDEVDYSGNQRVLIKSIPITKSFAKVETLGQSSQIGREFILRLYEPDANRDSKNEDRIALSNLEFRGEGGIRTTLSKSIFDANSSYLIETGPNTNTFEVKISIPRVIDGKTIHIGDWYEIRYIDNSTPSNSAEKIIFKGRIG